MVESGLPSLFTAAGQAVLVLNRPRKFMKSTFEVTRPDGTVIGDIAQKNRVGKIRFSLSAGGQELATMNGENRRAWDFNVQDASGTEIARVTGKTAAEPFGRPRHRARLGDTLRSPVQPEEEIP